jgi:hypothetical protein
MYCEKERAHHERDAVESPGYTVKSTHRKHLGLQQVSKAQRDSTGRI